MIGALQPRADGRRLALSVVGRLLAPPSAGPSRRAKLLVVRPDHLGDLLFLTPALRCLRDGFPEAEIVGLVGTWGVPVLERNRALDRLIAWNFPWFDRRPRRSPLAPYLSLARLANLLRSERFDLAVQFRPDFWWGALAVRLAGLPEQVGYDVPAVRPFLTTAVPVRHGLHAVEENLRLVGALTPVTGRPALEFPLAEADRRRARELLAPLGERRPLVALQVGAGAPVKLWPEERLVAVGRAVLAAVGARVVVVGSAAEAGRVEFVAREIGSAAIGLAGKTTLGELAAVLECCSLALGPDSGPLHLAVAVGTPTVHLFGPADPRRFGPYGDPTRHRVIASRWPCCPCQQLEFDPLELKAHRCMSEIAVEEVVEAARALLRASSAR